MLSELEQDPFDGHEFVERLAWRATAGRYDNESFDARLLHESFESGIRDLKAILDAHHKKCERAESVQREEQKQHFMRVSRLQERTRDSLSSFEQLDARLEGVSAKVVYLGDQLEGVNTPRARAVEAQKLMTRFAQFLDARDNSGGEREDESLEESADVIQKLHLIAHELPSGQSFHLARERIARHYDSIERRLIEEFASAQRRDSKTEMRQLATIASNFKGFSQCVDAFIEGAQSSCFSSANLFADTVPLCVRTERVVRDVFHAPEQVMAKFVLNLFHGKLQEFIGARLDQHVQNNELFLHELFDLFSKTQKLSQRLSEQEVGGCDNHFLQKITRTVFARHLDTYMTRESQSLREKCAQVLTRFYESRGHQRRPVPLQGSIQELRRDLQAKIIAKATQGIQIGSISATISVQTTDHVNNECLLLSEEVAISLLQETKLALQRCHVLSRPHELAQNAQQIFELEMDFLCVQHMDYALDLSVHAIPQGEQRACPELPFLEVVRDANAIQHLMEKQFQDSVLPLVHSTARHGQCVKRKRELCLALQQKLNTGLERALTAIVTWIRQLLSQEQKKSDFKPEMDDSLSSMTTNTTNACLKVTKFLSQYVQRIRDALDGRNVDAVLTELGVRVHRVLFEHFQQFQFSTAGAMVAICDVNEYRRCAHAFGIPLLSELFACLHALFNLLIVAPENLKHSLEEVPLERSVLLQFVCLRADYKSARILSQLKVQ